jgi:hypothetical protein
MKTLLTSVFGVAMTLIMASAAFAFNKYPPGPGATCPDTLTIFNVRSTLNTAAMCAPQTGTNGAIGDTVLGVAGIIIGFDTIPTGFDIYIQNSQGGQFTGIDVFTHGTNFKPVYGFNVGDSIVVENDRVGQFNGDPELESPNNVFSAPNCIFRKVSSGNALPPFFVGNTTDLVELPTNPTFPPYVGALIQLTGPVRVARTVGLSFHGMLVVRDAAPSDSVFVDEAKLSTLVPPAVGTYLTSVSGIGNSAARGFRIMPRDANDIVDAQPPGITDGYAVADNQYRIVYDRAVTPASATKKTNYSLASFGSVDGAALDGSSAVILTVSGTGLSHGQSETVTADSIVGSVNNIMMTTPVSISFLAGVLSCGEMSAANPDSLGASPCRDKSRYAGTSGQFINGGFGPRSTFEGIVVGQYGNLYYMEDPTPTSPAELHRGITVFAPPVGLTLGDKYIIAGADEEYYSENEFAAIVYVKDVGSPGVPGPVPLLVGAASRDTCDANQNLNDGRDYLSELVLLQSVTVVAPRFGTDATRGFDVAGPYPVNTDTIMVENQNNVIGAYSLANPNYPTVGTKITVAGCVHYTTSGFGRSQASFRVCPRTAGDITAKTTGVDASSTPKTLSFSVYPNPAHSMNVFFTLPERTDVHLGVYDIAGRRVALLASGSMAAGSYQKVWTGLDENGRRLHLGMYFYRLRAGNEVRTIRTILLPD